MIAATPLRVRPMMNDAYADRLVQVIKHNGTSVLGDINSLRRLIVGGQMPDPDPPEVTALIAVLRHHAVEFLQKWGRHPGQKPPYDTVRQHVADKIAAAGALSVADARWALDAWAQALNLKPAAGAALALEEMAPPPAPPAPPPPVASVNAPPAAPRAPALAPIGMPIAGAAQTDDAAADRPEPRFVAGGRSVPMGQGWVWLTDGWRLFAATPAMWIVTLLAFIILSFVIGLVPIIGTIASLLLSPVLIAGMMIGAQAVDRGEALTLGHLFAGFQQRVGSLMLVGVLFAVVFVAIVALIVVMFGSGLFLAGLSPEVLKQSLGTLAGAILLGALLLIPVSMAYYFAPPLVALSDLGTIDACKQSFIGVVRNALPFLLFGVVFIVLALLASLPFMLGWLVLAPVAICATYVAFHDIFYED
jgi:hypothetical protein